MSDRFNNPHAHATATMLEMWNHSARIAERKIAHALSRIADDMTVRVDVHTGAVLVEVDGKCYSVTIEPHKTERERLEEERNRIHLQQMLNSMRQFPVLFKAEG